jgi:hypothetical protein
MVTHWKHDKTEDKWRRRLKLKRNYKFDERLCQPLSTKSSNEDTTPSVYPFVNAKLPEKMKRFLLKGVRGITGDISSESCEDNNETSEPSQNNPTDNQASSDAVDSADSSGYHTIVQNRKEPLSTGGDNDYAEVRRFCYVHAKVCGFYCCFLPQTLRFPFHFAGAIFRSLCSCNTKKKTSWTIDYHTKCHAFFFRVSG